MATIGSLCVPKDAIDNVISRLNITQLGTVQRVSKQFYEIAGNDVFWENIFKRMFAKDVPQGMTGKKTLENCIIRNKKEFSDTLVTFLCRRKWEKKTRLECIFPNIPPYCSNLKTAFPQWFSQNSTTSAIIQLGFGPDRGTSLGFTESPVDETKYACFIGDEETLSKQGVIFHDHNDTHDIPCLISFRSEVPIPDSIFSSCFIADIEGIDVGYGNTLGYFASINQWKEPFELFCVDGNNGRPKWTGRIPYSEFKFVKIDPSGKITWEKIDHNRHWGTRSSGRPDSWEEYLKHFPISFA